MAWTQVEFEIYEGKIWLLEEKNQTLEKELNAEKAQSQNLLETMHVQSKGFIDALKAQTEVEIMSGLVLSDTCPATPPSASVDFNSVFAPMEANDLVRKVTVAAVKTKKWQHQGTSMSVS